MKHIYGRVKYSNKKEDFFKKKIKIIEEVLNGYINNIAKRNKVGK